MLGTLDAFPYPDPKVPEINILSSSTAFVLAVVPIMLILVEYDGL